MMCLIGTAIAGFLGVLFLAFTQVTEMPQMYPLTGLWNLGLKAQGFSERYGLRRTRLVVSIICRPSKRTT